LALVWSFKNAFECHISINKTQKSDGIIID